MKRAVLELVSIIQPGDALTLQSGRVFISTGSLLTLNGIKEKRYG